MHNEFNKTMKDHISVNHILNKSKNVANQKQMLHKHEAEGHRGAGAWGARAGGKGRRDCNH